jgi:hypothetical protein
LKSNSISSRNLANTIVLTSLSIAKLSGKMSSCTGTGSTGYEAGSAMQKTSMLVLLQIGSRLLTFVLNALVVRQVCSFS